MKMNSEQEKQVAAVNRLLPLANGDIELVEQAIRAVISDGDAADIDAVIRYILTHRK